MYNRPHFDQNAYEPLSFPVFLIDEHKYRKVVPCVLRVGLPQGRIEKDKGKDKDKKKEAPPPVRATQPPKNTRSGSETQGGIDR